MAYATRASDRRRAPSVTSSPAPCPWLGSTLMLLYRAKCQRDVHEIMRAPLPQSSADMITRRIAISGPFHRGNARRSSSSGGRGCAQRRSARAQRHEWHGAGSKPRSGPRCAGMKNLEIHLEHRPGTLADMAEALGRAGVSIDGGGIWRVSESAVEHFLVAEGTAGRRALAAAGMTIVAERKVLTQRLHQALPGQLGLLARWMADAGVNIAAITATTTTGQSSSSTISRTVAAYPKHGHANASREPDCPRKAHHHARSPTPTRSQA